MRPVTVPTRVRVLALVAALAAVVVVYVVRLQPSDEPRSEVVDGSREGGWQTIAFQDVRVDVPSSWERVDTSDCEFQWERWGPRNTPACTFTAGVAFYGSATFDPATGPGVGRSVENGKPTWAGYSYAGDFAVYAIDQDRDIVQKVLDSARPPG
jgi:hypothetical protein